jgi:helicase MOV-10
LEFKGDKILVQKHGAESGHWFEGYVHVVRRDEVGLRFHSSFEGSQARQYNVRFNLSRYPLRRQHQALATAFSHPRILFPDSVALPKPGAPDITPVNPLIAKNPPQLRAVSLIVGMEPSSVPFVIFGP